MQRYIGQRLILAVPTLLGLSMFVFFAINILMPVDAVDVSLGTLEVNAAPGRADEIRKDLGIDGSPVEQYLRWLGGVAFRGDLGKSFYSHEPVAKELLARLPVSFEIGILAVIITVVIAVPAGILSAVKQDSFADLMLRGNALVFHSVPGFWLAVLLIVLGGLWFGWVPSAHYMPLWEDPIANLKQVLPPVLLLGLRPTGNMIRLVRTQVLEVIRQDYVRTARAKGLASRQVYFRHVLRNALLPLVTVIGLEVPTVVSGTVIYETIFLLPGMGRFLIDALSKLDLFVILGANLFFGSILVLSNLVVDISYGFIDPRVRVR